jgi:uncharacterized membrane protein
MTEFLSDLSGRSYPEADRVSGATIREGLMELIRKEKPDFGSQSALSLSELNRIRQQYMQELMAREIGELSEIERSVLDSVSGNTLITEKTDPELEEELSLGQRLADMVAEFGGSWGFIIFFGGFIVCWIILNAFWLSNQGFDPYPFILLNLILSCLAAIQAPIIMMSQNRQEEKDRERAKKDYMVNLKSELEIRMLHEKIDHLVMHQQQRLLEVQQLQIEMMQDILSRVEKGK